MSFLNVSPCCVTMPTELPGEPRGTMQLAGEGGRTVARYIVKPKEGVKDDKAALVILYDLMGFKTTNPKIIADQYADQLGITVIVPDYIPDAPEPMLLTGIMDTFPGENAEKSWFATIKDYLYVFSKLIWKLPGFTLAKLVPICSKAIQELRSEGYERVGGIGYCRGGSMVISLLSEGDASLLDCGIPCHAAPDPAAYPKITKPSQWHFASHDPLFKPKQIAEVRQKMEGRGVVFEQTVHEQTSHGFAARPNLNNEASKKAFEEANAAAVKFLRTHLKLGE